MLRRCTLFRLQDDRRIHRIAAGMARRLVSLQDTGAGAVKACSAFDTSLDLLRMNLSDSLLDNEVPWQVPGVLQPRSVSFIANSRTGLLMLKALQAKTMVFA